METTGSNLSNVPDRAQGAVDRVAQTAHQAVDRIASKAGPAVERVRGTASDAAASMHSRIEDFSAKKKEWTESMRDHVRARPLAVVGLAVLAGMLLGRLSR